MNEFLRFKYYLNYQWRAKTKYYLHSPFVYQFYLNVLEGDTEAPLQQIEDLRKTLRHSSTAIQINDLGTGQAQVKKVAIIERKVAVRPKYGALLYRLIKYFNSTAILELGTSIGISSAYMALANPQASIISLEGSDALVELATKNHAALSIANVSIHAGNFSQTLGPALQHIPRLDLVFFDGNHRKEATLQYFNLCLEKAHAESIFIFDDIYWSAEMHDAWQQIKANPKITLTLDVFQFGICFFRKEKLAKEEFVLRY